MSSYEDYIRSRGDLGPDQKRISINDHRYGSGSSSSHRAHSPNSGAMEVGDPYSSSVTDSFTDPLTVQDFADHFEIISEEGIEAMQNSEVLVVTPTIGRTVHSTNTSELPFCAYLNIIGADDLRHLNEIAYEGEDGELVVDYDDVIDSRSIKNCRMTPAGRDQYLSSSVRKGREVRVAISISRGPNGNEWFSPEVLDLPESKEDAGESEREMGSE